MTTFADRLRHHVLAHDYLSLGEFIRLSRIIETYTQKTLGIERTKVFVACWMEGEVALMRQSLGTPETELIERVKTNGKVHSSQVALAFDSGKPLWIVDAKKQERLEACTAHHDRWSGFGNEEIPRYKVRRMAKDPEEDSVRTSIIIPLRTRLGDRVFGAINFRTSHYVEPTKEAKDELSRIAEAVAVMRRLLRSSKILTESTNTALEALEAAVEQPLPSLTKPVVFVASSGEADEEVIQSIKKVLEERNDKLAYEYWAEMKRAGNIMIQLIQVIGRSRYGICYFSQPQPNGDGSYFDNPNVIFEAGMFHGKTSDLGGAASVWIPIREKSSPELFFDLRQERKLEIERGKNGQFDAAAFEKALGEKVDAWFTVDDE